MNMTQIAMSAVLTAGAFAGFAQADGLVWGGWDASRTNFAGGVFFDGANLSEFRAIVNAGGDTIVPGTPELTSD
ncbi:MAG: hypothetical protein ACOC0P_07600 [Planctomycetota bacterium]